MKPSYFVAFFIALGVHVAGFAWYSVRNSTVPVETQNNAFTMVNLDLMLADVAESDSAMPADDNGIENPVNVKEVVESAKVDSIEVPESLPAKPLEAAATSDAPILEPEILKETPAIESIAEIIEPPAIAQQEPILPEPDVVPTSASDVVEKVETHQPSQTVEYVNDLQANKPAKTAAGAPVASTTDSSVQYAMDSKQASQRSKYLTSVVKKLTRYKRYPSAARKDGEEGIVKIAFDIQPNGSALNIRVIESSGNELLDSAAIKMVTKAEPFRKIPKGLDVADMSITIPISFSIELDS